MKKNRSSGFGLVKGRTKRSRMHARCCCSFSAKRERERDGDELIYIIATVSA